MVSNAECAIICSSYLCFLLAPCTAAFPAPPVVPTPTPLAELFPLDVMLVVGIRDSNPPNIPPPPPLLVAASEADAEAELLPPRPPNVVGEKSPLPVVEELVFDDEEDAVLGVISVSYSGLSRVPINVR